MNLIGIGVVEQKDDLFIIRLNDKYKNGLIGIDDFSMLNVLWWADNADENISDEGVLIHKPYTKGPESVGVFATRSQFRPNPICVSAISVCRIDHGKGLIYTYYIDAFPGTSVLDIKPYLPSTDIAKNVSVPAWCSHWPDSLEASADFDWKAEFNFQV